MCGICGALALSDAPVTKEELAPMVDAMRLRGPDGEGLYADGAAGLGHRRLSIIDLGGGHQPMSTPDGEVVTVLNGEIYNFRELRVELERRGHRFRTRSDTEALLFAYREWGESFVDHIDGMFALAIWDRKEQRLLLARDRFGKKPLVWFANGKRLVFASTTSALLQHPMSPRDIDEAALAQYLAWEFIPAPQSILKGVIKLPPGTLLIAERDGRLRERRYFKLEVRGRLAGGAEDEVLLRENLKAAVKKRLVADVPVGIFLSGGIDSSAIAWAAKEVGAGRIKTFSIRFRDASFDEGDHAQRVAAEFGSEHIEEHLDEAKLLGIVPRLGHVLDEPMADGSIVPTYLLSELARRHVTVALGGDGGDELLGGYPMYLAHRLVSALGPLSQKPFLGLAERAAALLPVSHKNLSFDFKLKKLLGGLGYPEPVRNYVWLGAFLPTEIPELLGRPISAEALFAPISQVYWEAPGQSHLERVLYQDVRLYLVHHILAKVDRASMAHSLEVRAPFLDTVLASHVAALPLSEKCSGLYGKAILRRALRGHIPEQVLRRPKKGFGMPIGAWLRGPLRPLAEERLLGATQGLSDWLDGRTIKRLLDEHQRGEHDHRKRLWTLLVLSLWRHAHLRR